LQSITTGKTIKSLSQNLTSSPPSGISRTSPSISKQVSLLPEFQEKELTSKVQIG
tara:strand:+ start:271 stop:435 length:165 start_codon:yes stop_codon:yes gene_type:complete